jgi:hypothetical protein
VKSSVGASAEASRWWKDTREVTETPTRGGLRSSSDMERGRGGGNRSFEAVPPYAGSVGHFGTTGYRSHRVISELKFDNI